MLTDPVTSITAGFHNARDDLAVAVMNAPSDSASLSDIADLRWDSLLQLNQAVLSGLLNPSTASADPGAAAVLDPADIPSLGADLAPNTGGLPLDLLP
jgi:hypothetical protein